MVLPAAGPTIFTTTWIATTSIRGLATTNRDQGARTTKTGAYRAMATNMGMEVAGAVIPIAHGVEDLEAVTTGDCEIEGFEVWEFHNHPCPA